MPTAAVKTKKVTTYGRKKSQIISIHSDFVEPVGLTSPLVLPTRQRQPLTAKPSNDNCNLPTATSLALNSLRDELSKAPYNEQTLPKRAKGVFSDGTLFKLSVPPSSNSPRIISTKQRKVSRKTSKAIVPRSPAAAHITLSSTPKIETGVSRQSTKQQNSPVRPIKAKERLVFEGVILPLRPHISDIRIEELSEKLSGVAIEDSSVQKTGDGLDEGKSSSQFPLESLIQACSSTSVQPFSTFIKSFPLFSASKDVFVTKVGEASYSEVFGFSQSTEDADLVLKVIPLFSGIMETNGPFPDCSSPEDVLREIEITKKMNQVPGGGFVEFRGAYVVEGKYPNELLEKWDIYKSTQGSASVRPSAFGPAQKYCLVALCNSGIDLEALQFDASRGWIQAAGIFWQVAAALASAEDWTKFEHRDLHEGQILISSLSEPPSSTEPENYLSPTYTSLQTTIIDFGLSRLNMPTPVWSQIPEEVYEGKGAQWDLYRAMRSRIGDDWDGFHAITNVMWLRYILQYMLGSKSLRKPRTLKYTLATRSARGVKPKSDTIRSEQAWAMLQKVEEMIEYSLTFDIRGARSNRNHKNDKLKPFTSARDLVNWGKEEGWIE
ncbi:HASPIN protein kinase [Cryptococcus gattii EJB2]|uniref:non-specific serine/threonine protein kinase n=1 Tax=Cryptococcus gattii EJB2 TaxID=1296103 RepID=A0ABR5BXR0_9TREE|nr:HASPIN protein kinase [Cryptococcus gattii EJB2]